MARFLPLELTLIVAFNAACASNSSGPTGAGAPPAGQGKLSTVADIQLPGDTSRWDYQSLDPQSHRLFIAHLGAGEVVVYDTSRGRGCRDGARRGRSARHRRRAGARRVYASATDAQQIAVIDADSLAIIATVRSPGYPDGLAYAPDVGKVYVSDEKNGNETIIDAKSNSALGSVAVGGEAGNTQYDPVSHHIFVAVQTKNQWSRSIPQLTRSCSGSTRPAANIRTVCLSKLTSTAPSSPVRATTS